MNRAEAIEILSRGSVADMGLAETMATMYERMGWRSHSGAIVDRAFLLGQTRITRGMILRSRPVPSRMTPARMAAHRRYSLDTE